MVVVAAKHAIINRLCSLHNYFNNSTKLFSYLSKFLDILAKFSFRVANFLKIYIIYLFYIIYIHLSTVIFFLCIYKQFQELMQQ